MPRKINRKIGQDQINNIQNCHYHCEWLFNHKKMLNCTVYTNREIDGQNHASCTTKIMSAHLKPQYPFSCTNSNESFSSIIISKFYPQK